MILLGDAEGNKSLVLLSLLSALLDADLSFQLTIILYYTIVLMNVTLKQHTLHRNDIIGYTAEP